MEIIAHVGPDHILEAWFKQNNLPEDFCFCGDDWAFTEALERLLSTSIVRQDLGRKMLYIHRLIQEEFRNWIGRDGRYVAFRSTSRLLSIAFPKLINGLSMRPVWPECKLYAAHVLILCARYEEDRYEPKTEVEFEAFLQLSTLFGIRWNVNLDTGDCEEALEYYEECIRINMQCPESHNRKFLHIPHTNIARLLRVTKDYAGSIQHAELSQKYSIDFLGPGNHFDGLIADYHKQELSCFTQESETHPTTIAAKLKLSYIAIKRKQYDIAINDLSKILIIAQLNESSKGDKGETARVLRKLAEAYELNGDQEQGSKFKLQAETIRKQIQGARFEKLPDEDQLYAMMSFHTFW
ncbi:hypothetical protein EAF00_001945 [Botryotinia globosa]|nr:hypothetical protein EAF00_001945 [Botryotinia globosa]